MSSPAIAARLNVRHSDSRTNRARPWSWIFMAGIAGLAAWGGNWLFDPATLPIKQVMIKGDFVHLSPVALRESASDVVRGGFFNVNVETIRNELVRDPWVRNVTVKRVWPDALSLNVREQEAVVLWASEGLLNSDGELFTPHPETFPTGLAVLDGPARSQHALLKRYFMLSGSLKGSGWIVEGLELDERRSLSLRLQDGPTVNFGRTSINDRIQRFISVVVGEFGARLREAASVDMRYTNGFSIRWAQGEINEATVGQRVHGEES